MQEARRPREGAWTSGFWAEHREDFKQELTWKLSKEEFIQAEERQETGYSRDRAVPLLPGFEPLICVPLIR